MNGFIYRKVGFIFLLVIALMLNTTFETKEDAKAWIVNHLTDSKKPFKVARSEKNYYHLICTSTSCNFKFKVSKQKGVFIVKEFAEHTCNESVCRSTSAFITKFVSPLAHDLNDSVKPKSSIRHLRNQFGIEATYMNAYRALKRHELSKKTETLKKYRLMCSWLEWMTAHNPGSIHEYREKTNEMNESNIEYCFFMPGTSARIFQNTLPIITLDACHTKGKYKGVIFVATAITGDDKGIILAYGVGPTESYEYWKLFVASLTSGLNLNQREKLVLISDREKGLAQAVREEVPNASHSFCVYHIEKNIKIRFRCDTGGLIWKMAKTPKTQEFHTYMQELRVLKGEQVFNFLNDIDPRFWARSFFPCPRYGHYTSNVAESINSSLGEELRKMGIFDIMTGITIKLSETYATNFQNYSRSNGFYPPKISTKIDKNRTTARTLNIRTSILSPQVQIQSESRSSFYKIYDKTTKKCTCRYTDEFGLPCSHILALSLRSDITEADYVIDARKNEVIKTIYNSVIMFCDVEELPERDVSGVYELPRRGRPRRSQARLVSQAELINRRTVRCRSCGQTNHNSRTCPARRSNNNSSLE